MSKSGEKRYNKDLKKAEKQEERKEKIANRSSLANATLGGFKGSAKAYAGAAVAAGALTAVGALVVKSGSNKGNLNTVLKGGHLAAVGGAIGKDAGKLAALGASIGAVKGLIESDKYKKEINHSGIKGQKWGVRRYQNPDGTLTDAGKARYNADGSKKRTETMTNDELEKANRRLVAERNYNSLMGANYKNRSSNTDIAIRAGASAVGSALVSGGAFLIRDAAKNPSTKIGKEKLKTAGMLAALGATIGAISSITTSLGGQANLQNIGDQKKKK